MLHNPINIPVMFLFGGDSKKKKWEENRKKALDLEADILATQGLVIDTNVWVYDVPIKGYGQQKDPQFIHTLEVGRGNQEKVVLIHGYGGTSVFMWKILAQMAPYAHVFAIDLYGQGLSSRPNFDLTTDKYDETVEFFCGAIEEWRLQKGLTEPFSLMGHSYGGYTSIQYVRTKNPPVKKLYLLSPAGMTFVPEETIEKQIKEEWNLSWFKRKFSKSIFWLIQSKQFTPFQLMSIRGKHKSLKGFFAAKRMTLSDKESHLISEFYFHVLEQNISSDKALGTFLFYARYSKKPGVESLKQLQEEGKLPPTTIWYGNKDWMDHEDCRLKLIELGLQELVKYEIISPSSHQIVFNQPVQVAQKIIEDLGMDFLKIEIHEVHRHKTHLDSKLLKS